MVKIKHVENIFILGKLKNPFQKTHSAFATHIIQKQKIYCSTSHQKNFLFVILMRVSNS